MSIVFTLMMVLLGSSLVTTFVLHPSGEQPAMSADSPLTRHNRCRDESLQSIRKGLLRDLNLQSEPWLPVGGLTRIREQWKNSFSAIAHTAKLTAVPTLPGNSETPSAANSTGLECCQRASEIFLKDLGWDNWVIYPESITLVQCTSCSSLSCPSHSVTAQENPSQVPCCQPTSQEMMPILYMDELSTLVISSVQLTRRCGCDPDKLHAAQ
ncbi:derriere protein-like [Myripristis murdjan]|uniref:Derriere protein-like n=1 Tax=Myripristis murdjan TaxID=586833 RepID=A0A667WTG5_9TELE|nr:derriere protein-like [Myripristis murdjan]